MKTVNLTLNDVEWQFPPARPDKDGRFWVLTVFGDLSPWSFTIDGGWNTHRFRGELYDESKINDDRVAAWSEKAPYTVEVRDV